MNSIKVTNNFSVSPQLQLSDLSALAEAGVGVIVCARPDDEAPGQTSFAEMSAEASRLGISAVHVPVKPGIYDAVDVSAFAAALKKHEGPVHGYCGSGMRAISLWALAQLAECEPRESLLEIAQKAGFDLSGALPTGAASTTSEI